MTYTPKCFYRGALPFNSGTISLFSVPSGQTAIVTQIIYGPAVANASNVAGSLVSIGDNVVMGQNNTTLTPGTTRRMSGLYVVSGPAEMTASAVAQNSGLSLYGIIGSGTVGNRTPFVKRYNPGQADLQDFPAGPNGLLVKAITEYNGSQSSSSGVVRFTSTPMIPWYASISPTFGRTHNMSSILRAGELLTLNASQPPLHTFTINGWQL